jgi:hypothetical protein
VTDGTNANFLQVLLRQAAEDPFVNLILSECRLDSSFFSTPRVWMKRLR